MCVVTFFHQKSVFLGQMEQSFVLELTHAHTEHITQLRSFF